MLHGFGFSVDEFLLVQEARVFASGHLAASIPVEWRPYIEAIQPLYVRTNEDRSLLTTGYFPGSAALYALFEKGGVGPLLNPTLAAGSVVLTAHIARRAFPETPEVAVLAAILLASSPQFLFTAMTPYAMTAHLFLNLAWLAFFIRDTRLGHFGAMVVGVAAVWQHQLHIHPLFALPFLADLAFRRSAWRLAATYVLVYGVALAGCMSWRALVLGGAAINLAADQIEAGGVGYMMRRIITGIIAERSVLEPLYWIASQLRFATWQTPMLLVLAACGLLTIRRAPRVIRLLTIGLPLALLPSFLLVTEQGIGWGFRYIHVHLGTLSLLAAWAVIELKQRTLNLQEWHRMAGGLIVIGLLTGPTLIVWRFVDFSSVVLPYRAVHTIFRDLDAEVLITGHTVLVRNDFVFRDTPKLLWLPALSDDQLSELCKHWNVAPVPREILARISFGGTS
ncbi:MAG: hypothetical protein R3245_07830, partial [Kiloniellales bacterium]|nr:hypothetical protein [Kiloniellales bacterium]